MFSYRAQQNSTAAITSTENSTTTTSTKIFPAITESSAIDHHNNPDHPQDFKYWNFPRDIDEFFEEEATPGSLSSQKILKDATVEANTKMTTNRSIFSFQSRLGWMSKKLYLYSGGHSKGAFSIRLCSNTTHPWHAFTQHEQHTNQQRLQKKLKTNDLFVDDQIVMGAEKFTLNKTYTNQLILICIHVKVCTASASWSAKISHYLKTMAIWWWILSQAS